MFVLIGEYAGDYDDYYARPVDAIAVSGSKEKLEAYWAAMEDHEFVGHRIEGVDNLDTEDGR